MIVEIHGAGFQNKGAELMLRTVVSELHLRVPGFAPAIDPTYGAYELRCGLRLRQIMPPRSHVGSLGFSKRFLRQKLFAKLRVLRLLRPLIGASLDTYGLVDLSRVQAFVDISGFAYTDQWGPQPIQDLAALTRYYRRHRRPVILLPQAFGPFERPEGRSAFAQALDCADLVFARDKQSRDYAVALASEPAKVLLAPDITLFSSEAHVQQASAPTPYACIIPNIRMLDQGRNEWGGKYQTYLTHITRMLVDHGTPVRVLVHDTSGGDARLAESIWREVPSPDVTIVREHDPLVLKHIIGQCLLLVGSRYHSLVAAFANAVPALALGWAHKYGMLFQDFDCERLVIAPDCSIEAVLRCVAELVDPVANAAYRESIAAKLEEMRPVNHRMWQRVTDLLASTSG